MGVTRLVSYLPLHTLVLVVEAVVMATARISREKSRHLVLVQIHIAGVGVRIFVVNVELAALAAARLLFAVFRKIHSIPLFMIFSLLTLQSALNAPHLSSSVSFQVALFLRGFPHIPLGS